MTRSEAERFAMKLQVEEGLPESNISSESTASDEDGDSNNEQLGHVQHGSHCDVGPSDDSDAQLAWNLQVEENDDAVLRARQERRQLAEAAIAALEPPTDLRMGARPYAATVTTTTTSSGRSQTRSSRHDSEPVVTIELPPDLRAAASTTRARSTAGASSTASTDPQTSGSGTTEPLVSTTTSVTTLSSSALLPVAHPIWYDASRPGDGDEVFLHLLGNYPDDTMVINNNDASSETRAVLALKLRPEAIPCIFSCRISLGTAAAFARIRKVTIADMKEQHQRENSEYTLIHSSSIATTIDGVIRQCEQLQMSVREAAVHLPFAVRFQLERWIFDNEHNQVRFCKKRPPANPDPASHDRKRSELAIHGRKLLIAILQMVLPPLLRVTGGWSIAGDHASTRHELFAHLLWGHLKDFQKALALGNSLAIFDKKVEGAAMESLELLQKAEKLCQCTEDDLNANIDYLKNGRKEEYLQWIRKRSLWPMAEYRCKFTLDGRLVPKSYEVVNLSVIKKYPNMKRALQFAPAATRRAMRELAWNARDRFVGISDIEFHDIHRSHFVDWCRAKPALCHRRYEFLLDKGTGRPTVWLFSPSADVSRDDFLQRVGVFGNVDNTKLGDRISLAFTTTKPLVQLDVDDIVSIPEVVRNGYLFSDGCGVMGMGIAKRIMEIDGSDYIPGSIQVRIGGAKGMLTIRDGFYHDKIGIRPSMCKFPSNHRLLEVKMVAKKAKETGEKSIFSNALLIMHHLGVSSNIFMDLQRRAWAEIAIKYDHDACDLLKEPVDYDAISRYLKHVVTGEKPNKEKFRVEELNEIIQKMEQVPGKVHLRCSFTMLQGVIDEHDFLNEGEILVGNGEIQGPVLIFRPPCHKPGDIQKAFAVPGREKVPFKLLKESVVFSTKGERPLADMLGGGDYDGDKFYIISEPLLVKELKPISAYDYGSQKSDITSEICVYEMFSTAGDRMTPSLEDQLGVFQKYLNLGDIVSSSAEAWLRLADSGSSHDRRALSMASLCVRALDARKQADVFNASELDEIHKIISDCHPDRIDKPRWRGGDTNFTNSILGALYDKWAEKMECVQTAMRELQQSGDAASVADDGTFVSQFTQDTRQFDKLLGQPSMSRKSATEILIDVTFGRKDEFFQFNEDERVNFRCLSELEDRLILVKMVLREYEKSLRDGREQAARDMFPTVDEPHDYGVFLIKIGWHPERLAVCQPKSRSVGGKEWRLSDGTLPLDDVDWKCYVASLSSSSRILESLMKTPIPPLMEFAMKREALVDVVDPECLPLLPPAVAPLNLNLSQRIAVATVMSKSFRSGFLALQGPPGCGKTSTIVGMVLAVERALLLAPSNAAVANVALKLLSTTGYSPRNVVVWGENCDKSVYFLNPTHRYNKYQGFLRSYGKIDDEVGKYEKLQEFACWLRLDDAQNTSLKDIVAFCNEPDGRKFMSAADVVLCTLNTAGSKSLRSAVAPKKIEIVILDEASQCPEAEFYIATTFPNIRRIVVVGDPQQLPSTVLCSSCQRAGYGESFLSHIFEFCPERVHLLDTQYRMDPPLLEFANATFYGNRIKSDSSVLNRNPHVENNFLFISTSEDGFGAEEWQGHSCRNPYEAGVIKSIIQTDKDIIRVLEGGNARIIIITPYNAQVMLLRKVLKKVKRVRIDISTVDSVQGQEGDIVLLSTVRSASTGFVDDANRLCVALTRAKRVLRVVGDKDFFKNLSSDDSIMRRLATYAEKKKLVNDAGIDAAAWIRPKWKPGETNWKATMTSRFHYCLKGRVWRENGMSRQEKGMSKRERNIAFNTLLAIATPRTDLIRERPNVASESPRWQMSSLKNGGEIYVVWLPKSYEATGDESYVGVIEAHFAGNRLACNNFIQTHQVVPAYGACRVTRDLSAIDSLPSTVNAPAHTTGIDFRRWDVTEELQNAVMDDSIDGELPEGTFLLDDQQKRILELTPPLLLESRSGTGKTNVLFQHAVAYARQLIGSEGTRPFLKAICFVTVSPKLQEDLDKRYSEVKRIAGVALPPIFFFSFRDFIQRLLDLNRITDRVAASSCRFLQYVFSKKSHEKLGVEASLAENEIGGVIKGSLTAALKKRPLNEDEYLDEARSNIPKDKKQTRRAVYKEYLRYQRWMKENHKYDIGDIVLQLIRLDTRDDVFQSAYLDEVQDFSYAAIYLICSIAGRAGNQWVAAGDTAQMISPGCSFKFVGLKQTLLKINEGIQLRKVEQLKRNYRMDKGVLEVGNAILRVLKATFPGQIEYSQPEIPMKDLGLKVAVIDWDGAFNGKTPSLGPKQAVVYSVSEKSFSGSEKSSLANDLSRWTRSHPIILSSLDAKGLEFEDVIVVFSKERSSWNIDSDNIDALMNLRELYVAITRAQRRVVVLVKKKAVLMATFFKALQCELDWVEPGIVMPEFDQKTTPEEWFTEGMKYFKNHQYGLAKGFFNAADSHAWSNWAHGKELSETGQNPVAREAYRTSSRAFFEQREFTRCLDVMKDLAEIEPWSEEDNDILDSALHEEPNHLERMWAVKFAIFRGSWSSILVDDLQDKDIASVFQERRQEPRLKEIIRECRDSDRAAIMLTLPLHVGDYCIETKQYSEAVKLFLRGKDHVAAADATDKAIAETKDGNGDLVGVVKSWRDHSEPVKTTSIVTELLSLFGSPKNAAKTSAARCMARFGPAIVKLAVNNSGSDATLLHNFDRNAFHEEVEEALIANYENNLIEVVTWYQDRDDKVHALAFAEDRLMSWSDDELLTTIFASLSMRPKGLESEIERRNLCVEGTAACLQSRSWDLGFAEKFSNMALRSNPSQNARRLVDKWRPVMTDARVRQKLTIPTKDSDISLLLKLIDRPAETGRKFGDVCMAKFGKELVKDVVLAGGPYPGGNYPTLRLFDGKAFESEKPKKEARTASTSNTDQNQNFHFQIGQRVQIRGVESAVHQHLNGQIGTINKPLGNDRFGVYVDSQGKLTSFHGSKLFEVESDQNVEEEEVEQQLNDSLEAEASSDSDGASLPGMDERRLDDDSSDSSVPNLAKRGDDDSDDDEPSVQRSAVDRSPDESAEGSETESLPRLLRPHSSSEDDDDDDRSDSSLPQLIHPFNNRMPDSSSDSDSDGTPPPATSRRHTMARNAPRGGATSLGGQGRVDAANPAAQRTNRTTRRPGRGRGRGRGRT